jgi:hypothetical protein
MTNQHSFVSSDRFDRDPKTAERVLNGAIVQAEITESFEEYLEIFDAFYADDVEVSSDAERVYEPAEHKVREACHFVSEAEAARVSVHLALPSSSSFDNIV